MHLDRIDTYARRMIRRPITSLALLAAILAGCSAAGIEVPGSDERATADTGRVVKVADGDTITVRLADGDQKVRLLGIDSPESSALRYGAPDCGGKQAKSKMLALVFSDPVDSDGDGLFDRKGGTGRTVTLTTDPTQDRVDRYERLLAYASLAGSDTTLQQSMLAAGLAEVYVFNKPFERLEAFERSAQRGRDAGRGVYGACGGDFHSSQD